MLKSITINNINMVKRNMVTNLQSNLRKKLKTSHKKNLIYPTQKITTTYLNKQIKNQEKDINNKLWDKFNIFENKNNINLEKWVSPSSIRFRMMDDGCVDLLKTHNKNNKNNNNINKSNNQTKFETLNDILNNGNQFEDNVYLKIQERFPDDFEEVSLNSCPSIYSMKRTFDMMEKGVPFIAQGILYNFTNNTYGVTDLLIRSDWVNKLFDENVLGESEISIPSPVLKKKYHYVVIDIKYSKLQLCADGKKIRNSNNIAYYKSQLTIYNAALGLLQGYTPNIAYILCKAWKYTCNKINYEGHNCFERVGCINFTGFDKKYINKTYECVKWIRDLRINGSEWSCNPPSNKNLYPNMNNRYDAPYHTIKKEIAEDIGELTTLWYVNTKNRDNAHKKGIFDRYDKKLSSKILEINGRRGEVLDQILYTNNNSKSNIVEPSIIKTTDHGWNKSNFLDFYLDIETIDTGSLQSVNINNSKTRSSIIFCIGVGYEVNGKWMHHTFYMDTYDPVSKIGEQNEFKVINDFFSFINERTNNYRLKTNNNKHNPRFFHWAHAEITSFRKANSRHGNRWDNEIDDSEWIDMYKIFVNEPITIEGAYNFNLKNVAKAFYKHNLINTIWNDSIVDGYQVVIEACEYYKYIIYYNKLSNLDKVKNRKTYRQKHSIFNEIIKYNEIDCKVMWEIIAYLRKNHF
jgi:hypothetical protein